MNGKKYTVVTFPVEQKAPSGQPYSISGYIDDQNMVAKVETRIEDSRDRRHARRTDATPDTKISAA